MFLAKYIWGKGRVQTKNKRDNLFDHFYQKKDIHHLKQICW